MKIRVFFKGLLTIVGLSIYLVIAIGSASNPKVTFTYQITSNPTGSDIYQVDCQHQETIKYIATTPYLDVTNVSKRWSNNCFIAKKPGYADSPMYKYPFSQSYGKNISGAMLFNLSPLTSTNNSTQIIGLRPSTAKNNSTQIIIIEPKPNFDLSQIKNNTITVKGIVHSQSKIIAVLINEVNSSIKSIMEGVEFSASVPYQGNFVIEAIDRTGSIAKKTLTFKSKEKPQQVGYNSRIALIIGNGDYKNSPLKNPMNDANDMAAALKKLGFKVSHLINASKHEMVLAINKFGKNLKSNDVGLFYYSGHGMQVNGRNYLIPIDANVESEGDVEFESVDAGRLLSKMNEAENRVNIVILDACRNNPFKRRFRSSNRGLARINAPTGSFVIFATSPGSVADDGKGRNGIFTKYFLKHIKTPRLKIEDIMKRVRKGVLKDTGGKQTPWQSSSMTGDFYFRGN